MPPARLQWAAAVWRRSAAVARRLPQTAAHNDERCIFFAMNLSRREQSLLQYLVRALSMSRGGRGFAGVWLKLDASG